jgi:hypothetical protein
VRTAAAADAARATIAEDTAREYVGKHEHRSIRYANGALYLQRDGGPRLKMVPADGADEFTLEVIPEAKIRFGRDATGIIDALHVLGMSGAWEATRRE